jgi:hypothetical protein
LLLEKCHVLLSLPVHTLASSLVILLILIHIFVLRIIISSIPT